MDMLKVPLPALKKYQNIAGIAAGVGFGLGTLIPGLVMLTQGWHCPFGNGILQIGGFLTLTGFGSAVVLGNFVAFFLIRVAKYRRISRHASQTIGVESSPPMKGNKNSDV